MGDPFLGEIAVFAGGYAPYGWAFCDGRLLPIQQYSALFSLLGTRYGGDGMNNFALPDLRGRCGLGMGYGPGLTPRSIGEKSGNEKVGLGLNELPTHNHAAQSTAGGSITGQVKCVTEPGDKSDPSGAYIAAHDNAFKTDGTSMTTMNNMLPINASSSPINTTLSNAGGNAQHENMHPYLVVNYIIALQGIYPQHE